MLAHQHLYRLFPVTETLVFVKDEYPDLVLLRQVRRSDVLIRLVLNEIPDFVRNGLDKRNVLFPRRH